MEYSRTCPEETIYQLGTKDGSEDPAVFVKVAAELFEVIQEKYGSHMQILDWALHMDEATPHIHERHAANVKDSINYIVARINRENPYQFFEPLTPHGLRHTFATNCIENGMEPKTLQKILGRNSLQMTMDLYCHVRESTLTDEMERIANFM